MVSEKNADWVAGTLSTLGVEVAHYSRLAAITVPNDSYNFICLSYQIPDESAAIKMVSYSGNDKKWIRNTPDLRDPPLLGTSLTAVPPRRGILVAKEGTVEARFPVLYLQLDNLKLAHSQGGGKYPSATFYILYLILYYRASRDGWVGVKREAPGVFSPH
jgi:hypothetical protein